jgi:lipoprotein-anchoring transpeptidase ErfK/SrfK
MIRARSTSRWRRRLLAAGAAVTVAVVLAALRPIALGWTSPPVHSFESARRAVAEAREAGADVWAPELMARAEEMLHDSSTELRRQELRFVSLRDFTPVRKDLIETREAADRAAGEAAHRREAARSTAEESLAGAARTVEDARTVGDSPRLRHDTRRLLAHSNIRLAAAERRYADGDYVRADAMAREAAETASKVVERGAGDVSRFTDPGQIARWRKAIEETVTWSRRTGRAAIVVNKERNQLSLYVRGRQVRTYPADMGVNVGATKLVSGDGATPEGRYKIVSKKGPGQTRYHRALLLDYPNQQDLKRLEQARREGRVPKGARPGGLIEIHGEGGRGRDWTRGCPALSNRDMDDLFARVQVGTPVTIVGGDGNGGWISELYMKLTNDVDSADSSR